MNIEKVSNGYILTDSSSLSEKQIFTDLDRLFSHLLLHFEGRSEYFGGSMYGRVTIDRQEKKSGGGDE